MAMVFVSVAGAAAGRVIVKVVPSRSLPDTRRLYLQVALIIGVGSEVPVVVEAGLGVELATHKR